MFTNALIMANGIILALIFWEIRSIGKRRENNFSIANFDELEKIKKKRIIYAIENNDGIICRM